VGGKVSTANELLHEGMSGAGGLNDVFGRLTGQTIELQTVETVERIVCPIGRDDREDVELQSTFFNMNGAEKGVREGGLFSSGLEDTPPCALDGFVVGRCGRRECCICDGSVGGKRYGRGEKFVGKVDGWRVQGERDRA